MSDFWILLDMVEKAIDISSLIEGEYESSQSKLKIILLILIR